MPISLVGLREIPLSSSAVYKKIGAGAFPRPVKIKNRNYWVQDDVDAWFEAKDTANLILGKKDCLLGGFTEAELRGRGWGGVRDKGLNLQGLKILMERGILERRKLRTEGRPRVEFRWRV